MRWKSSQLQHRQQVDPERQGIRRRLARRSEEGHTRVSEGLEAGASGNLRPPPGTPAAAAAAPGGSGGPAAEVDALAATFGRLRRDAGVVAVGLAAAAPAAGLETEASSRPGTAAGADVEPDTQPARRGHRRVGRRVDILADVARANPFTPPPGGPFSVWR